MCAKPEPTEVLRPLADLAAELHDYDHFDLREFAWVGITTFYGVLENA